MKPIPQFEPDLKWRDAWAVARQVLSGYIGPGKAVAEFESRIADWYGAPHCISTTSGTTALMLSLMALDLSAESTVLFPAYTMLAGANAARLLGLNVQLCDIDPRTLGVIPEMVEHELKRDLGISAVIHVEHNGHQPGTAEIAEICRDRGVKLIRDAAQAFGFNTPTCTIGDVTTVSFSPQKVITTGQGGAMVTHNDAIAERLRQLVDHGGGWRETKIHQHVGGNFRLSDIQAAMGNSQMRRFLNILDRRRRLHRWYQAELRVQCGWAVLYRSRNAPAVINHLQAVGIGCGQPYRPVAQHAPYASPFAFPGAEQAARELVYLPSSTRLTRSQVKFICREVKDAESAFGLR